MLRRLVPEDLDSLYTLYRDPEIRHYFPEGTLSRDDTREELEWHQHGHPRHPELGLWATIYKETGEFVGRCGLIPWTIDGAPEVEVAYMIDKHFQRQGLGAEAARALVQYGFAQLRLRRIVALIDPENVASIHTAQRAGLSFEREFEMDGVRGSLFAVANAAATEIAL